MLKKIILFLLFLFSFNLSAQENCKNLPVSEQSSCQEKNCALASQMMINHIKQSYQEIKESNPSSSELIKIEKILEKSQDLFDSHKDQPCHGWMLIRDQMFKF